MNEVVQISLEDKIKEFEKHIVAGDAKEAAEVFQREMCDGTLYNQENGFQIIEAVIGALSALDVNKAFYTSINVYTDKNYKSLSDDERKTLIKASVSSLKKPHQKYDQFAVFSEDVPDEALGLQARLFDLQMENLEKFKDPKAIYEIVENLYYSIHSESREQKIVDVMYEALPRFDSSEDYLIAADFVKEHLKSDDDRMEPLVGAMSFIAAKLENPYDKEKWLNTVLEYEEVQTNEIDRVRLESIVEQAKKAQERLEQYIESTPVITQKFIEKYTPQSGQHLKS